MTGAELIGSAGILAGKIVTETAKDIRETEQSVRKELVSAAKETDEFKHAARLRAKRIAIKEAAFLQVFRPIRKLIGLSAEYFEHGFDDDMQPRLEAIPEENRVAPKASIAAPAMQGLAFSLDEPDLKRLYLDLLASASDSRQTEAVHPAFVEIIRQLSADEVSFLRYPLSTGNSLPIVRLNVVETVEPNGKAVLLSHIMELTNQATREPVEDARLATYVDNWIRLGLVDVVYGDALTRTGAYDWAETRPEVQRQQAIFMSHETLTIEIEKGLLKSTAFGESFALAVGMTAEG